MNDIQCRRKPLPLQLQSEELLERALLTIAGRLCGQARRLVDGDEPVCEREDLDIRRRIRDADASFSSISREAIDTGRSLTRTR